MDQFEAAAAASGSKVTGWSYTFPFEDTFNVHFHRQWFAKNWTVSFLISLGYVAFVYLSTQFMKNRKGKFDGR